MILQVENNLPQQNSSLSSFLSSNVTVGGTALPIKNNNFFQNNWAVQLGNTSQETAEIVLQSPNGTQLDIQSSGTLRFSHSMDTPVYQIHYDKVIFSRSTTGTAGTAAALSTVSITPDSLYTQYDDTSGVATYAYKSQYYNSLTGDISAPSDWFIPGGPSFYSLQKLRTRGKKALFNANFVKDDTDIDDWINEWIDEMTNKALKVNQAYSSGTTSYSFGTAGFGTVTEPLFKYASKVEITTDGINYYSSNDIPLNQYDSNDIFSASQPRHSWQSDSVFQVLPFGNAGTARFTLGKLATKLVNDADELPLYLRGYTAKCIEYILYRVYDLDQKDTVADKHYGRFTEGKQDFIAEATPRDRTGPDFIEIIEETTGNDNIIF